ncbi:MAG: condensation domain-containing protein, partial [Pseudonocardiaceae bacterium]
MTSKPSGLQELLPLSPLQEGMLFHALVRDDGPDVYTVQWGITLEGPLDTAVLQAAGQALLDRHPNLRAAYRYVKSGRAVAVVPYRVELPWHEVALSGLSVAERDAELARCLTEERNRRFDLSRPPLMRFTLVRFGSECNYLAITFHHILLDGWSIPLLRQELFALYARGGGAGGLAPAIPYRDYLAWLATQDRSAAEGAWRRALAGLEEPTLLGGTEQHPVPLFPERVRRRLPEQLSTALTQRARQLGVTLSTVIQGAWGMLLSRLAGREDVVFGFTVSGRPVELAGVESIIGLFINTVPARVPLPAQASIGQVLTRLQANQTELMAYHHLGLADIQRLAGIGPLFDTLVVYENFPSVNEQRSDITPGLRVTSEDIYTVSHYPLSLLVIPGPRIAFEVHHRKDVFDREAGELIAGRLVRILEAIATDPDQPVNRIDILTTQERHRVLVEWNDTTRATPETTLPELFETQAARTPDATAVVFEDTELTYTELNSQANRLARVLIDQGAGPERIVALALPRSADTVLAILAVQKAGAAYLPIDPENPYQHIAQVLDDADPVLLVTTEEIAPDLPSAEVPQLVLDAPSALRARTGADDKDVTDTDRPAPLCPLHPAYVIYTSGSTG